MSVTAWTSILVVMLCAPRLSAAELSTYRGFTFGAGIAAIAEQAGLKPADAKAIHKRPAVLQEMEWQLRPQVIEGAPGRDPVREGLLCFLDGKLYRIVITYDRYRVEGMTVEDMVEAISLSYGAAERPDTEIVFHSNYAETAKVLARWQDAEHAYDLVRTGDRSSFALVLYAKRQDALAQAAIREASRLDSLDAPGRALEAEKKRAEDERRALEVSRTVNKPNFRP